MNESYCSFMEIHILTLNELNCLMIIQACIYYIVLHSLPLVRGENNQRVWRWGKKCKGKKEEKENLGKTTLLAVPNHKKWLTKHNLTLFEPLKQCFIAIWGKNHRFCNATWRISGKKIKCRGGELINDRRTIYYIHIYS